MNDELSTNSFAEQYKQLSSQFQAFHEQYGPLIANDEPVSESSLQDVLGMIDEERSRSEKEIERLERVFDDKLAQYVVEASETDDADDLRLATKILWAELRKLYDKLHSSRVFMLGACFTSRKEQKQVREDAERLAQLIRDMFVAPDRNPSRCDHGSTSCALPS